MFATTLSTVFRRSRVFDPESLGGGNATRFGRCRSSPDASCSCDARDWDRLGGMDEDYFLYGEDAEFSLRAGRAGLRRVIVPDAVIVHEVGGSSDAGGAKGCMVMAGKVTCCARPGRPSVRGVGVGLLVAGVGGAGGRRADDASRTRSVEHRLAAPLGLDRAATRGPSPRCSAARSSAPDRRRRAPMSRISATKRSASNASERSLAASGAMRDARCTAAANPATSSGS